MRCTGHCCRTFFIASDLTEKLMAGEGDLQDGEQIRDMLLPTGKETPSDDGECWWTCRHFDGDRCTIYEDRPKMCSGYPYGAACTFEGCTLSGDEEKECGRPAKVEGAA